MHFLMIKDAFSNNSVDTHNYGVTALQANALYGGQPDVAFASAHFRSTTLHIYDSHSNRSAIISPLRMQTNAFPVFLFAM